MISRVDQLEADVTYLKAEVDRLKWRVSGFVLPSIAEKLRVLEQKVDKINDFNILTS